MVDDSDITWTFLFTWETSVIIIIEKMWNSYAYLTTKIIGRLNLKSPNSKKQSSDRIILKPFYSYAQFHHFTRIFSFMVYCALGLALYMRTSKKGLLRFEFHIQKITMHIKNTNNIDDAKEFHLNDKCVAFKINKLES